MSDPFHIVLRRLREAVSTSPPCDYSEFVKVRRRDLIDLLTDFDRLDRIVRASSSKSGR